jgi:hypothetical protein
MTTTIKTTDLTPATLALFTALCKDAHHWSGVPLLDVTPAEKGNLTDLKKLGLISTTQDDDNRKCVWVEFKQAGRELAKQIGHDLDMYYA